MDRLIRETGRGLFALLAALTLLVQSVLPVYADTADNEGGDFPAGDVAAEEESSYSLEYFDRIAVNSISGTLTISSGDDFGISFPAGWEETPGFSVQDDILVVSGRKSEAGGEGNGSADAVVLGEDEPSMESADSGQSSEAAAPEETAQEVSGEEPETVITIPAGVGLDTLRVAIKEGRLVLTDVTANSVTIQSGGGDMEISNVSLGTVDIYSEIGAIFMEECTFNSLNIGIGEGDITVYAGDLLEKCRMEIKTGQGDITYNGNSLGTQYMQPGSGKRFLTIQAGAGNIDINDQ